MKPLTLALAVVFAATVAFPTFACLNEYKLRPKTTNSPSLQSPPVKWAAEAERLQPRAALENSPYTVKSDYAVALLHLGRNREAIQILEPLAKRMTNEYQIISNLGTAYELDGQLESARKNISRAIQLKPDSHEGTEWLHVKILDAKIALAKNPDWLQTNSVLGLNFGNAPFPTTPPSLKSTNELRRVTKALVYQLRERLQFVHPPDPTVADLLFDLANVYRISKLPANAIPLYKRSLQYGDLRQPIIKTRLSLLNQPTKSAKLKLREKEGA